MQKKQLFVLALIGVATYLWAMDKGKKKEVIESPLSSPSSSVGEQLESELRAPERAQPSVIHRRSPDSELVRNLREVFISQKLLTHRTIKNPTDADRSLTGHFSHNGTKIITTAVNDNRVIVWDSNTAQQLRTMTLSGPIIEASFNMDDSMILARTALESTAFDTATGNIIRTFPATGMFSPDGSKVIILEENRATIRDTRSGTQGLGLTIPERSEQDYRQNIHMARFSYDNSRVMTIHSKQDGADNDTPHTAIVWDVQTGRELFRIETDYAVSDGSFSSNGNYIVIAVFNGPSVWDGHTGQSIYSFFDYFSFGASFSADGLKLLLWPGTPVVPKDVEEGEFSPEFLDLISHALLWDINEQKELQSFNTALYIRGNIATLSANEQVVATILDGGTPVVWNAKTRQFIVSLPTESDFVTVSPDGDKILTNKKDGQSIILWDLNDQLIQSLRLLTSKQHRLLQEIGDAIRATNNLRRYGNNPNLTPRPITATREQMTTFLSLSSQLQKALQPYITDNYLQQLQRVPEPARSVLRKRYFDRILGITRDDDAGAKRQKEER